MKGYRMILIMPDNLSLERRQSMTAFGAELILVTKAQGMEGARDLAEKMRREGKGIILDQFANPDNPLAHYRTTGPELWRDTQGKITHFVSAMGTTGTIMGVSKFLKEKNPAIAIVGAQPAEGASIPGIRKWPPEYLPKIFDAKRVDRIEPVTQPDAEETMRRLAREEGIFGGVSSGGACAVALRISQRSARRDHRVRRLRPRRSLPVDGRVRAHERLMPILAFDIECIPDYRRHPQDFRLARRPRRRRGVRMVCAEAARHVGQRLRAALPAARRCHRVRAAQRDRLSRVVHRRDRRSRARAHPPLLRRASRS